jgi:glycosyltransferase involved in cell wall biosynthesis
VTGVTGVTQPSLSVVVSTYEWPEALDAVLRGFADQTDNDFELVVADDGSGPAAAEVVARWKASFGERVSHVWQEDAGFRLARVRDLGALATRGDYLVFVDGDCVPRRRFIASIRRAASPGWFLAGKRADLGPGLSRAVLDDCVPIGRWSAASFWRHRHQIHRWVDMTPRDRRRPWRPKLPDFTPHGNAYGFLMAMYAADFEAVNGFDLRYIGWGEQDVDLAVRLRRLGLRSGWAGPKATMLHLAHPSNMPLERLTWWLLQETMKDTRISAVVGIRELRAELEALDTHDVASNPVSVEPGVDPTAHRAAPGAVSEHLRGS